MKLPVDDNTQLLIRIYQRAQRRLELLIGAAVDRGAEGTADFYVRQLREVGKVLADLKVEAEPVAMKMIGDAYVQGVTVVDVALGNIGKFSGVDQAAVNILADNLANKLNEASITVGRQAEDLFRRIALEDVTEGIITGQTRKAVSAAFRQNLIRQGATGFVDKAGRRWTLETYTKMVARTTTREAVTQGTANRLLANGDDLVTISSHDFDADECEPYDGQTFSMTGATPGYEVLDDYPPFHPNCVHVLTPAAASFEQFESALGIAGNASVEVG